MKTTRDQITLETTGRKFYANNGILGIGEEADHLSEGYDGGFGPSTRWDDNWDESSSEYTHEEVNEIYEAMVARWAKWRDKQLSLKSAINIEHESE